VRADFLQRLSALHVRGRADDLVRAEIVGMVVPQAALHKVDGQIGKVNSDPAPLQPFGNRNGRSTAAEGIENDVTLVAARSDDALKKLFRFLLRIPEPLRGLGANYWNRKTRDEGPRSKNSP
jgi:hypothetical protein